jgi:hypothetical protein
MNIPGQITAGDSVKWTDDNVLDSNGAALSPGDWTLNYAIRGAVSLDLVATPSGAQFQTAMSTAQSATLTPAGTFYWTAFATNAAGERVTVGRGTLVVLADITAAPAGYDGRTQDEKDLVAVRAAISARITGGVISEYSIAGRTLKNEPLSALRDMESRILAKISRARQAEMIANGQGNPRQIFVRF